MRKILSILALAVALTFVAQTELIAKADVDVGRSISVADQAVSIVPTAESVPIVKITADSSLADRFAVASGYLPAAVRDVTLSRAKALTGDQYLATSIDFTKPSLPERAEQPPLDVNAIPPERASTGYDKPGWVVADAYDADVPYVRRT